jgi:acyl-CoA dehydrogenase
VDFAVNDEQRLILETVRRFLEQEIYPYEAEVDRAGEVAPDLARQITERALAMGLYAINMPSSVGGPGLDEITLTLVDRELGKATWALVGFAGRRTRILLACAGTQIERYLLPCVRAERIECFALTEPGAGSDVMAITTAAARVNAGFVLNGAKHFISSCGVPDFAIVLAVTGVDTTARGPRKRITAFLVDRDTPGFDIRRGPAAVSYRGYHNYQLFFTECRVGEDQVLGEEGNGLELAQKWLLGGRVKVAAGCCGKAERILAMALDWAAERRQFGRPIAEFQAVSFKLADMATELRAADMLTLDAASRLQNGTMSPADAAMAKVFASEMLGRVADHAVQIFGGMGLVEDLPIERFWRDARIERIWDGTSEIQRHIISRELLRSRGARL